MSAARAEQNFASRRSAPSLQTVDAERDTAAPPTTLEAALHGMFAGADIAFTGQVISIDREAGAVVIRWQVEDAICGVNAGSVYAVREWPGLWEANSTRYLPGQRALLMLHAPSVAGYTSPVHGGDGFLPLQGDAVNSVLDLRLLAQRVLVTDAARLRPAKALHLANGFIAASNALQAQTAALAENVASARRRARPQTHTPEGVGDSSVRFAAAPVPANSSVDGALVLNMLHAWQRARFAAQ